MGAQIGEGNYVTHQWGVAVESEAHSGNEGSGRWRVT